MSPQTQCATCSWGWRAIRSPLTPPSPQGLSIPHKSSAPSPNPEGIVSSSPASGELPWVNCSGSGAGISPADGVWTFFATLAGGGQPGGLEEGSRWSFRAKGERPPENRVGGSSTPEWVPGSRNHDHSQHVTSARPSTLVHLALSPDRNYLGSYWTPCFASSSSSSCWKSASDDALPGWQYRSPTSLVVTSLAPLPGCRTTLAPLPGGRHPPKNHGDRRLPSGNPSG